MTKWDDEHVTSFIFRTQRRTVKFGSDSFEELIEKMKTSKTYPQRLQFKPPG